MADFSSCCQGYQGQPYGAPGYGPGPGGYPSHGGPPPQQHGYSGNAMLGSFAGGAALGGIGGYMAGNHHGQSHGHGVRLLLLYDSQQALTKLSLLRAS